MPPPPPLAVATADHAGPGQELETTVLLKMWSALPTSNPSRRCHSRTSGACAHTSTNAKSSDEAQTVTTEDVAWIGLGGIHHFLGGFHSEAIPIPAQPLQLPAAPPHRVHTLRSCSIGFTTEWSDSHTGKHIRLLHVDRCKGTAVNHTLAGAVRIMHSTRYRTWA
jgi:hypothetical protein